MYGIFQKFTYIYLYLCVFGKPNIIFERCFNMKKYVIRLVDAFRNLFKRKNKAVIHHAAEKEYNYNQKRADNHKELNRLLDKINRYGKESLTKSEQEFLENTHEF